MEHRRGGGPGALVAVDLMIGADFPRSSAWQVVSQWHADADGSPPIGFYADDFALASRGPDA